MIEMNKEILTGEDFSADYNKLCQAILAKLNIESVDKIDQRGNLVNLVAVFDSETSNYVVNDEKRPFIISEMMTFLNMKNNTNISVLFRHLSEYLRFMNDFSKFLKLVVKMEPLTDKYGQPVVDDFGEVLYDTSEDRYLSVYVHNLPFDASFLLPEVDVFQLFASGLHKPYYFITKNGFRFVDTAVLTQNSLAGLGKKLQRFHVEKKVGDFDYDVIRTPETPFTEKEKGYVLNDVLVLAAYIAEFTEDNYYANLNRLPLTQTGIVRDFLRRAAKGDWSVYLELFKDRLITKPVLINAFIETLSSPAVIVKKWFAYHDLTVKQAAQFFYTSFVHHVFHDKAKRQNKDQPDNLAMLNYMLKKLGGYKEPDQSLEHYKLFKEAYQGGFTHANAEHTGKLLENVHSFDFTSSYPTRILSQYFAKANETPRKLTEKELNNLDQLMTKAYNKKHLLKKLYVFRFSADEVNIKDNVADGYMSDYYLKGDHKVSVNGRVIRAKNIEYTCTSIDWEIIRQVYNFKNLVFLKGYTINQQYLPRYIVASTIHFYTQKTKLKHVKGRESDYMRSKQMLNSTYGCMVSNQTRPNIKYNNKSNTWEKWDYYKTINENKQNERQIAQKEINRSFMPYIWGVEVSAYARVALWRGIIGAGDDYVYSDTDSLKLLNWQQHLKMINKENKLIISQIDDCLNHYGINPINARPKDIKGKEHQLGVWDADDGDYRYFKTLGAKRYIDIDDNDNFEITIAGLAKKSGSTYILQASKCHHQKQKVALDLENVKKLFNFFSNEMYVPAKATGKLASFYIDHYDAFRVRNVKIPAGGGCLLQPVDFTMSMAVSYESILNMIAKGYTLSDKFIL